MAAYDTLVDTDVVADHLDDPEWILFDCRFELADPEAGEREYRKAHIPGARYVSLDRDLAGPVTATSGRHPLPHPARLAAKLGQWGLGPSSQAVAYDDQGGAFAARLWWLLRWLGHRQAAVLDGGLRRWRAEGRPLDQRLPAPLPRAFEARPDDRLWLRTEEIADIACGNRTERLLDARDRDRYRGEREPVDPVAGHIPGALNVPFKDNLDANMRFLPPAELAARFRRVLRDHDPRQVVHSCGSGVTACHNLLAMEVAGLHGSRLYAGSFSEWIRDPARAVDSG